MREPLRFPSLSILSLLPTWGQTCKERKQLLVDDEYKAGDKNQQETKLTLRRSCKRKEENENEV